MTAIILIDLQNEFFSSGGILGSKCLKKDILSHITNFLNYYARPKNIPVYWVKSIYSVWKSQPEPKYFDNPNNIKNKSEHLARGHFGKPCCVEDTKNAEIVSEMMELICNTDPIITKHYYSSFVDTNLEDLLRKDNITDLLIGGVTCKTCVLATTIDAKILGFNTTLLTDCVSQSGDIERTFDFYRTNNYANLLSTCEIIGKFGTYGEDGQSYLLINVLPPSLSSMDTFELLRNNEINWGNMYNREKPVPRLVAIQGSLTVNEKGEEIEPLYRHPADEQPNLNIWTPTVAIIKDRVGEIVKHEINHGLIQCYRTGQDWIGEHSDKTIDILKGSVIINVSLGAKRRMILEKKEDKQKQHIYFPHNSMFVLDLETNRKWLHSIKQDKRMDKLKTPDEIGERISFTFRTIGSFYNRATKVITGQGAKKLKEGEEYQYVDDSIQLLQAFSKENRRSDFDWDSAYGEGFYSLNFKVINSSEQY